MKWKISSLQVKSDPFPQLFAVSASAIVYPIFLSFSDIDFDNLFFDSLSVFCWSPISLFFSWFYRVFILTTWTNQFNYFFIFPVVVLFFWSVSFPLRLFYFRSLFVEFSFQVQVFVNLIFTWVFLSLFQYYFVYDVIFFVDNSVGQLSYPLLRHSLNIHMYLVLAFDFLLFWLPCCSLTVTTFIVFMFASSSRF